jgi:CRISPR-associated protein Csb1
MDITKLLQDTQAVALTFTEFLEPIAGRGTTVFPATYADRGYLISNGIAVMDSVQSQANRIEAIFKQPPYDKLVPQILINDVNLLDIGHRAADAFVGYSSANELIRKMFKAAKERDFGLLAKFNPTSLVLGVWDSRGDATVKIQRALGFTVDALGVATVRDRAAQYKASIDSETKAALKLDGDDDKKSKKKMSEEGFNDIPSFDEKKGGVIAEEIVRRGVLNVQCLRRGTDQMQAYLLGLGLVMLTYPLVHDYRQGALLVSDPNRPAKLEVVYRNGQREAVNITHEEALAFAQNAAAAFGVGENRGFELTPQTYKQFRRAEKARKNAEAAVEA